jgi:Group 4 capsule polysaccharide lipoprotein gfcB, YjbF
VCLCGCTAVQSLNNAADTIDLAVNGFPDTPIDLAALREKPYASQLVRIGKGPKSSMILAEIQGETQLWIGADRSLLYMRHGRIIKTAGLYYDIHTIALTPPPWMGGAVQQHLIMDWKYRGLFGVHCDSLFTAKGHFSVLVADVVQELQLWEEALSCPQLKWRVVNSYWVAPETGVVWQSEQTPGADLPIMRLEIIRSP